MRSETITWEGGEHEFALSVPLLIALEEKSHDKSIGAILQRLELSYSQNSHFYSISDIKDTVSLALEGGGMKKQDAYNLVLGIISERGLYCLLPTAYGILGNALMGWPDDEGKPTAEAERNS